MKSNLLCLFHAVAATGQMLSFKYSEDVLFVDMSVSGVSSNLQSTALFFVAKTTSSI